MELVETKEVRVRGTVQGVGFRPTVWRLAHTHGLVGEVLNDDEGVLIRISGQQSKIASFLHSLVTDVPPLAHIASLEVQPFTATRLYRDFQISRSLGSGGAHTQVSMDAATCPECAAEIEDTQQRRYLYPFTNCTHCGPRLSIVEGIPYDRSHTTMAGFPMCELCRAEYEEPADRRFHAQPIACHLCGPRIWLGAADAEAVPAPPRHADLDGAVAHTQYCLAGIVAALHAGKIVALRGLGGFHLCCDATSDAAVQRLRERKRRYAKPFALMARDLNAVHACCRVTEVEAAQLQSPNAPIVLLERGADARHLSGHIAPGSSLLGFMLPYTPLHLLIAARFPHPLVMTSGNFSEEPQIIDNHSAQRLLGRIADLIVYHDRDIANRIDDSVLRCVGGKPRLMRRARGYAPQALALPRGFDTAPDLLAYGGELKATFCLLKDGAAILSQHQGDLEDASTFDDYEKNLKLYAQLYRHRPRYRVADRHPEYLSTKLAWQHQAQAQEDAPDATPVLFEVQHHHAHIASCMIENGLPLDSAPVLGIALDGLGYGVDGALWGGEFLLANYHACRRLGSLKPVPMIGGMQAILEPWRNTYAHIVEGMGWETFAREFGGSELHTDLSRRPLALVERMLAQKLNAPYASSCGRLFDAAAAAVGLCRDRAHFEGQGALELEMLTDARLFRDLLAEPGRADAYPFATVPARSGAPLQLDPGPLWHALCADLARGTRAEVIATRFHAGLVNAVMGMVKQLRMHHAFDTVALSGGCLQNRFLLEGLSAQVEADGLRCLSQARVPANDGGLALGQVAIGAALALNLSHQ